MCVPFLERACTACTTPHPHRAICICTEKLIYFKLLLPGTLAGYPAYVLHTSTHSTSYYQHKQTPFKDLKRTLVGILKEVVCTSMKKRKNVNRGEKNEEH